MNVRQAGRVSNCAQQIDPAQDGRRQPRTHLFVVATLASDAGSTPVHIRNMSPSGALVEAAVLPGLGERISLRRGELQAIGQVAWRAGRRAGVRLDDIVHVSDWLKRQGSAEQERVDAVVAGFRAQDPTPMPLNKCPVSIEAEMLLLRSELAALESALVADMIVVATHPEIQTLDIALQRVDRILKRLRGGA
jgi:hypothetical protein